MTDDIRTISLQSQKSARTIWLPLRRQRQDAFHMLACGPAAQFVQARYEREAGGHHLHPHRPQIPRRNIREDIEKFTHLKDVVGIPRKADDLPRFLKTRKPIIVTTQQKFAWVLEELQKNAGVEEFARGLSD